MHELHTRLYIIGRGGGRPTSAMAAAAYRSGSSLTVKANVVAAAAYRSNGKLKDADGHTHDFSRKHGVAYSEIFLPKNAPKSFSDRQTLWLEVERAENKSTRRATAQFARQFQASIPKEFSREDQLTLIREFVTSNFTKNGMIADVALHDKGDGNPHTHVLLTTRSVTLNGFGNKNRNWNNWKNKDFGLIWRHDWATRCNSVYERLGLPDRIDPRSFEERGIKKEVQIHLGKEANQLEKRGEKTELGDKNRAIIARNVVKEQELMSRTVLYMPPEQIEPEAKPVESEEQPSLLVADGMAGGFEVAVVVAEKTMAAVDHIVTPVTGDIIEQSVGGVKPTPDFSKSSRSEMLTEIRRLSGQVQSISRIEANILALDEKLRQLQARSASASFSQRQILEGQIKNAQSARQQALSTLAGKYRLKPDGLKSHLAELEKQIQEQQQVIEKLPIKESPVQEKPRERAKSVVRSR